jgi:hypothetical protein
MVPIEKGGQEGRGLEWMNVAPIQSEGAVWTPNPGGLLAQLYNTNLSNPQNPFQEDGFLYNSAPHDPHQEQIEDEDLERLAMGYVLPPADRIHDDEGLDTGRGGRVMGESGIGGSGGEQTVDGEEPVEGPRGRKRGPDPGNVDGEAMEATGKRARRVNCKVDKWVKAVHAYLKNVQPGSPEWQELVDLWFGFESGSNAASSRLPAANRPKELSKWVSARQWTSVPLIEDAEGFADQIWGWWWQMQGDGRKGAGNLPIKLTDELKGHVAGLKKRGPTGIVVVLVGLKWWATTGARGAEWKMLVEDVLACFRVFVQGSVNPTVEN